MGGDYNPYDISDNNFCNNGLVSPDRKPHPHMKEVAHQYRNIIVTPVDLLQGMVNVSNEYIFTDLSDYILQWSVLENGKPILKGMIDNLNTNPGSTEIITLPYSLHKKLNTEYLLNVDFITKREKQLIPAGFNISQNQLEISPYQFEISPSSIGKYKIDNDNRKRLIIEREEFKVEFDKKSGMLCKYEIGGKPILNPGSKLSPIFWRAPIDNEYGSGFVRKSKVWRNPEMKLKNLSYEENEGHLLVKSAYEMPQVNSIYNIIYEIGNDGSLSLKAVLSHDNNIELPEMNRFGIRLPLPSDMNQSRFYGRGPEENYVDRSSGTFIGIYELESEEQAHPYIRPQETGTHSDIRWWEQTDKGSFGIKISSKQPFYASALNYDVESLDNGDEKTQQHFEDIDPCGYINLIIDSEQAGVGGINSWSELPLKKYRLNTVDKKLEFKITPIK